MPPPSEAGESPDAEFPVMMLFSSVGVPAAFTSIPPPLPEIVMLFSITFPIIWADPAPPTSMPAPVRSQPGPELFEMVLFFATAEENLTAIPAPSAQAVLLVMRFPMIVGEASEM
jgi:hypothetical protein